MAKNMIKCLSPWNFLYYATVLAFFFFLAFLIITHNGEAINIEEYAPQAIPTISGSENSLMDGTKI